MIGYDDVRNHWKILFQIHGSIWIEVLPYCVVNLILAWVLIWVQNHHLKISFSPQGHALMSLIISFLVVSKLQVAFYRYMEARSLLGLAFAACRDLHQHALVFTQKQMPDAEGFRADVTSLTLQILTTMISVIKRQSTALELVRGTCQGIKSQDPMTYVMLLRSRICNADDVDLVILEKLRMFDMILRFIDAYRELLKLASTPMPFPMVQMGRTCLFLWVFTMPFVLVGVVGNLSVGIFLFFLTYGFIGMELVAMHLLDPFGDNVNDLGVDTMTEAIIQCIRNDAQIKDEHIDRYDKHSPPHMKQPVSPYAVLEGGNFQSTANDPPSTYQPPSPFFSR